MKPKNYMARLYVLNGTDVQGSTDPKPYYLKVYCSGDLSFEEKEYSLCEEVNTVPQFYKSFEFPVTLPGPAVIDV